MTNPTAPKELLPCPFCGSDDIDHSGWMSEDRHGPACQSCGATADSEELWNRRSALREREGPTGVSSSQGTGPAGSALEGEAFSPCFIHLEVAGILQYLTADVPTVARKIDRRMDLLLSMDRTDVVGVQFWGVKTAPVLFGGEAVGPSPAATPDAVPGMTTNSPLPTPGEEGETR